MGRTGVGEGVVAFLDKRDRFFSICPGLASYGALPPGMVFSARSLPPLGGTSDLRPEDLSDALPERADGVSSGVYLVDDLGLDDSRIEFPSELDFLALTPSSSPD
jgi:hypothetical protein